MSTLTHEQRKAASDARSQPAFFYTYVLELDNGDYYVGSTNDPVTRFTEHAINGAVHTAGHRFEVRLVNQFGTRREAEYNEKRIQDALERGPMNIAAMIDNFARITNMIRPPKTLRQLEREAIDHQRRMERLIHKWPVVGWGQFPTVTVCGWEPESTQIIEVTPGLRLPGWRPTPGTAQFVSYHHPQSFTWQNLDNSKDACPDCLALRPQDEE